MSSGEAWKPGVNAILSTMTRVNGKAASERTKTLTKDVVYASFRQLHRLGYKIQDPKNLIEKHIRALVRDWHFVERKRIKTMQNDLSRMRVFCRLLGKSNMVKRLRDYLEEVDPKELVVHSAAQQSKSWAAKGMDMPAIMTRVDTLDWRLGLMLRMQLAFGLRENEVLKCNPWRQDHGGYLEITPGHAKGGRPRMIPIGSDGQRQVLDYVKANAPKNQTLAWKETGHGKTASLKQNEKRFYDLMRQLGFTRNGRYGVTSRGLRAQFAENHALMHGLVPPTLGGTKDQMGKDELKTRTGKLSEAMGHVRERVMGSYYGTFTNRKPEEDDHRTRKIDAALAIMDKNLPDVPFERRDDCLHILLVLAELGCDPSPRMAHVLWQIWCRRCGVEWMKPEGEILAAIESSAVALLSDRETD